jgi:MscS family membrane protein
MDFLDVQSAHSIGESESPILVMHTYAMIQSKLRPLICLALIALSGAAFQVAAQESVPETPPTIVLDDFNRGTPASSIQGFMLASDANDFETAAEYLDLRNLRGAALELTGAQLARRLYVIATRGNWTDVDQLIDDPAGRSGDGQPNYRDSIGVVTHEGKQVRLLLQKVPRGDGESVWKVSNSTVSLIPELYEDFGYPEFVEDLRRRMPVGSFMGYEYFKWMFVLGAGVVAYGLVFLIALVVRRSLGKSNRSSRGRIYRFLIVPVGLWVVILTVNGVGASLGRGFTADALQKISPIPILVTVWVIFAAITLFADFYSIHLKHKGRPAAQVLLRPASNALKLLVFLVATLVYLDQIGINITTVLAGLGVGGVAVALALQKPMEDVFGAITLYTQQPVRIGDFCRVGDTTGTIEEIGLRTTYIRTLADTRIAVPNSTLATLPIDNISAREKILYRPNLRLRYDTEPGKIRRVLEGIRELLSKHERVLEEGCRVRFNEIGEDALKIEVFAYLDTKVWQEYLELAEEINLLILDVVAREGTSLSLPASTLHIEQSAADA